LETSAIIQDAIAANVDYICAEVLADAVNFGKTSATAVSTDLESEGDTRIDLSLAN
jgi:hypothetical protein